MIDVNLISNFVYVYINKEIGWKRARIMGTSENTYRCHVMLEGTNYDRDDNNIPKNYYIHPKNVKVKKPKSLLKNKNLYQIFIKDFSYKIVSITRTDVIEGYSNACKEFKEIKTYFKANNYKSEIKLYNISNDKKHLIKEEKTEESYIDDINIINEISNITESSTSNLTNFKNDSKIAKEVAFLMNEDETFTEKLIFNGKD